MREALFVNACASADLVLVGCEIFPMPFLSCTGRSTTSFGTKADERCAGVGFVLGQGGDAKRRMSAKCLQRMAVSIPIHRSNAGGRIWATHAVSRPATVPRSTNSRSSVRGSRCPAGRPSHARRTAHEVQAVSRRAATASPLSGGVTGSSAPDTSSAGTSDTTSVWKSCGTAPATHSRTRLAATITIVTEIRALGESFRGVGVRARQILRARHG